MLSAGFKPAINAIKRLQTYALDSTAAGIGIPPLSFCLSIRIYIFLLLNSLLNAGLSYYLECIIWNYQTCCIRI
jgi:hypothetical protein